MSQNGVWPLVDSHLKFLPVAQQVRNSWNSGLQGLVSVTKPYWLNHPVNTKLCGAMPVDYLTPLSLPTSSLLHNYHYF